MKMRRNVSEMYTNHVKMCQNVSGNVYIDLSWRLFYILALFVPAMLWLNLSEDITKIIVDLKKKFGI